jgi:[protein-PII] uridylyltransferase
VSAATRSDGPRLAREALLHEQRLRGRRFCHAYSDAVDGWLAGLFAHVAGAGSAVALIAVGGHGRRALCPGSDLDLVLVHDGVAGIAATADALWHPIWDAGVHLDHSVRTARETLDVAAADVKAALGLLSLRHIAGDVRLSTTLSEQVRRQWADRPKDSLGKLRASLDQRWEQYGELAFRLEPDVKLARGGLRDVEALDAAVLAAPVAAGVLDDPRLDRAGEDVLSLRVALHAVTGRRGDVLTLDSQDAVARRLGHVDADELMSEVSAAGRRIAWATDHAWRRIGSWLTGPSRGGRIRPLGSGIVQHDDALDLASTADLAADPSLALRLAAASARTGLPITAGALLRLETEATPPPEPWPAKVLDALVDLLGCGHAAVGLLETLDHLGVLGRYIREWSAVRSRPQRNAYHRYTVDRHLLEAAAEAAALARRVDRPDLLLIGALLHDIGKGFPGDHTEVGVQLTSAIARRMGFVEADVAVLGRLVDNHLLLADVATRRDIDDPATIAAVVDRVPTGSELDVLAALTEADSIATGSTAWSPWKAELVETLVHRAHAQLTGRAAATGPAFPSDQQRALMAQRHLMLVPRGSELTVVAPDQPGLLAAVATALAVNGLPVRAATCATEEGMAVQVFDLDLTARAALDWSRIEDDVARCLVDPGALTVRLAERARQSSLPKRPGGAQVAPPQLLVDNDATPRATIVDVRAPDEVGLLSRLVAVLARSACDITFARVLTYGHEVVDTFYVTDHSGAKLADPARLSALRQALLAEISGSGGGRW